MPNRRPATPADMCAARGRVREIRPALADVLSFVEGLELDPGQHHQLRGDVQAILTRAHKVRDAIDAALATPEPAAGDKPATAAA